MLYLVASGVVSENVVSVRPHDQELEAAQYGFEIECTNCREMHDSVVAISRFEKHELPGSRGEASFVLKCKFCRCECSITLNPFEEYAIVNDGVDKKTQESRKKHGLRDIGPTQGIFLQLDCRGCEVKIFHPESIVFDVELKSGTIMQCQLEKGENEWYDYDEDAGEEVSITEFDFTIVKGK